MASSLRTPSPTTTTTNNNRNASVQTSASTQRQQTFLDKVNHTLNCISIVSVFAVHFLLITATIIASRSSDGEIIAFYNAFFFVALFLAVYEHLKPGPLQLATVINLLSIIFDILMIGNVYYDAAQLFLIINIVFRPLTTVVLLRKSYQRKRRLQLHSSEATSLASAIKNLLYNPNADALSDDLELGKPDLPTVLSTLPNSRRQ
ncbi:hypothetical protein TYRP_014686 [Tyrophagus putrescentiae]|nr:hypothetical protein TYRP_009195 [Tyrophagus putrescentiae]KAH9404170.1 hypothetical protein TYRP_014686 [Tyrophagus putrescentiae]